MAACQVRLFPSTKGWFLMSEKPRATAFLAIEGYRFSTLNVIRGWARAESNAPTLWMPA
jgi:hypothetical protein